MPAENPPAPAPRRRLPALAAALLALSVLGRGAPAGADGPGVEPAHFHHVHLNAVDPARSIEFYRRVFGGVPVRYRDRADAVFTERSFLLLRSVAAPAPSARRSGIWHIGWGGVDVPNEYRWLIEQGVEIHTPLYPLGRGHVVYLYGPDQELIEVNTMGHHRFAHVHLLARDPDATAAWYARHFGARARGAGTGPPVGPGREFPTWEAFHAARRAWSNGFQIDNVSFVVYNLPDYTPPPPWWREPPLRELEPQRGRAIDHFALSYRDLEAARARLEAGGVEVVEPVATDPELGLRSFFVAAPDGVTVEVVEERPIPEGVWDTVAAPSPR